MKKFNIKFTSIASGSSGNCYLLEGKQTKILLECGISVRKIDEALNHKLYNIDACLVTHKHKDHCKAMHDVAAKSVPVYALQETLNDFPKHHRFKPFTFSEIDGFRVYDSINIGDEFTVYPFSVEHDVENVGFFIQSNFSHDRLLFIIDTYYSKYTFPGVTHYCIECNYSSEILAENVKENSLSKKYVDRIYKSHFSLESLCEFFAANDLSKCKEINLMHMSSNNGDADLFKRVIEERTGKLVTVCEKSL